jgi:AraC-like DNA-binding protein
MQIDRKLDGGAAFKKNRDWEEALKRSEEILDLFGKFYSGTEVHKIITTEWKYRTVKYDWVLKFQRENVEMIEQLRDEYQKNVSNVRLVHKRSRLDELSGLYQSRKAKYEQSESREDYKLLLITIEQIRKEIEGQRLTIDGHIQVEHEHRIQEHVNTEILKHLNINDLIVSRLCARLKMSPKYLLYRLHQSYYKKFTGFLPKQTETESVPIYPSSIVYDFDNIHDKMEALELKDAEHLEEAVIVDTGTSVALRDLVTKKLAEKRESLDKQRRVIKVVEGPEPTAKRKITTKRAKGKNKTKNKK